MTGIIVGFLYPPLHFASVEEERQGRFFSLFSLRLLSFLLEGKKRHPVSIVHASFFSFLLSFFVFCRATPIMEHTLLLFSALQMSVMRLRSLASGKPGNPIAGTSPRTQISIHRRECLLFISHAPPRGHYLCNPLSWLREPPPKT